MMDWEAYSSPGGHRENEDVWEARAEPGFTAVLCDGLGGMGQGASGARFVAERLAQRLGTVPECAQGELLRALEESNAALHKRRERARTTALAFLLRGREYAWANVGDTRAYHFSENGLVAVSADDTVAYAAYRRGEVSYANIRLYEGRSRLTRCLGEEAAVAAHAYTGVLRPGDGVLLCSDGFWQYVFETEMEIDYCKAENARDWLARMLIRLAHRSRLQGDNCTALALIAEGG